MPLWPRLSGGRRVRPSGYVHSLRRNRLSGRRDPPRHPPGTPSRYRCRQRGNTPWGRPFHPVTQGQEGVFSVPEQKASPYAESVPKVPDRIKRNRVISAAGLFHDKLLLCIRKIPVKTHRILYQTTAGSATLYHMMIYGSIRPGSHEKDRPSPFSPRLNTWWADVSPSQALIA